MRTFTILFILIFHTFSFAQHKEKDRLDVLEQKLNTLSVKKPGLLKTVNFNVKDSKLPDFVNAVANLHQVDIGVDTSLNNILLANNFSDATVKDILLYLCKEYKLTLELTGSIISIKKYNSPKPIHLQKELKISYQKGQKLLSFELKKDTLFQVFKKISQLTDKNLVFAPGMEDVKLTGYINKLPIDNALEKLAFTNNLTLKKTPNHHYIFESNEADFEENNNSNRNNRNNSKRPKRNKRKYQNSQFYYHVKDTLNQVLEVDFTNVEITEIIENIGFDLKINSFTTAPISGKATVKAKKIHFDDLLKYILQGSDFSYKKQGEFYFFGDNKQLQIHQSIILPLQHRSIQVFDTPSGGSSSSNNSLDGSSFGNNFNNNSGSNFSNNSTDNFSKNNTNGSFTNNNYNSLNLNSNNSSNTSISSSQSFLDLIPAQCTEGLEIKIDNELNSFIVEGPSMKVNTFKEFVKYIDKPIPIILIEVMIIESNKSLTLDTGIKLGVRDTPTQLSGQSFPDTSISLGAKAINRIIGGFDAFGIKNLGKVVPNFYATIKAMESNGVIKIKSTPKLATLNSHNARLSIGQTTYYAVTQTNIIGSQNPQTSEITNYFPINAQLAIDVKPLVAGDGSITLSINVTQSNFNGTRISEEAPPGLNSREFSSAVRVQNNDMVILGGLDEKIDNDTNTGVPLLARIPILKYLFSSKKKEDSSKKLSILIKPTILR